ncbi:MAG: SDR family NAD(P)-dependent oxidoreductase [Anaerolineales bacterium]
MPASLATMNGKICLVTGATSGVGLHTALGLARRGADVILVARRRDRAEAAARWMQSTAGRDPLHILLADLSRPDEVRRLAQDVKARVSRLDVLVNDAAGIFLRRRETADGLESTFALNHLSYFLLSNLLLDLLAESAPSRVVNVASNSHWSARIEFGDLQLRRGYSPLRAYANSKLGNVWFTYELARRIAGRGVTANTLTPGFVATNLGKQNRWIRPFLSVAYCAWGKPPAAGAETPVYLAASPEVEGVSGKFFIDKRAVPSSPRSYDETDAARMWQASSELVGLG